MLKKNTKPFLLLYLAFIFLTGCKSSTVIFSNPGGSKVYINGNYKGETPYVYSSRLPVLTGFNLKIEKEGYQDYTTKVRRFEKPAAPLGAVLFFTAGVPGIPFGVAGLAWGAKYKRSRIYDLSQSDGDGSFTFPFRLQWSDDLQTETHVWRSYINQEGNVTLLTRGNELITLDDYFYPIKRIKIEQSKELSRYTLPRDIVEGKENIILIYESWPDFTQAGDITFSIQKIDAEGNILSFEKIATGGNANYFSSENKQYFGFADDDHVISFDSVGKKIVDIKRNENQFGFKLNNKGDLFGLEIKDENFHLVKLAGEEIKVKLSAPSGFSAANFVIDFNKESNLILVSSTIGVVYEDKKFRFGPVMSGDEFKTVGSFFNYVNATNLQEEKTKQVLFSNDLLEEAKTIGRKHQEQGLIYIVNRGVLFIGDDIILQLEQSWKKIVTTKSNDMATSQDTYYNDGYLLLVNPEGKKQQSKLVKKTAIVPAYVEGQGSFSSFTNNDHIYLIYNNVISTGKRKDLVISVLDTELNNVYDQIEPTYEDRKTYVHSKGFEGFNLMKDGKILFLSSYKKNYRVMEMKN